jgi:hypothetical protein
MFHGPDEEEEEDSHLVLDMYRRKGRAIKPPNATLHHHEKEPR